MKIILFPVGTNSYCVLWLHDIAEIYIGAAGKERETGVQRAAAPWHGNNIIVETLQFYPFST